MSLRHLIRVGRHWINPRFLVRIEDLSRPEPDGDGDSMGVVMLRGDVIPLRGGDAAELRRLLDDREPCGGPTPDDRPSARASSTGETLSGHGPMPLVVPEPHRAHGVPE